jgi:O-antigen/teichoic acid export membrane protein
MPPPEKAMTLSESISRILTHNPLLIRIFRAAGYSVSGAVLSQGLAFIASIAFARLLGKEQFGLITLIISSSTLFVTFSAGAITMTASKFIAERRIFSPGRVGSVISLGRLVSVALGITFALLLSGSASIFDRELLHGIGATQLVRWSGALVFLTSVNAYQLGVLAGFEDFRGSAVTNAIKNGVLLIGGALLSWKWGLSGTLTAYLVGTLGAVAYASALISRKTKREGICLQFAPDRQDWKLLTEFSGPVLLSTVSFTPIVWWANANLSRTAGLSEVGVFQVANQWQMIILFFANALSALGVPILSNLAAAKDHVSYWKSVKVNTLMIVGSSLALAIPVCLASGWITKLYGHGFAGARPVLIVMALSAVISAANIPVGHIIWSLTLVRSGVLLALLRGLALLSFSQAFVRYGALGLALAYLSAGILQSVVTAFVIPRLLRQRQSEWTSEELHLAA